ncbi:hypothetical protein LXL04_026374 [Taraxacum kok-saghyz]
MGDSGGREAAEKAANATSNLNLEKSTFIDINSEAEIEEIGTWLSRDQKWIWSSLVTLMIFDVERQQGAANLYEYSFHGHALCN